MLVISVVRMTFWKNLRRVFIKSQNYVLLTLRIRYIIFEQLKILFLLKSRCAKYLKSRLSILLIFYTLNISVNWYSWYAKRCGNCYIFFYFLRDNNCLLRRVNVKCRPLFVVTLALSQLNSCKKTRIIMILIYYN